MYLQHYGLREMPFNITPDPRYLFFSRQHREAVNSLVYGIEQRAGFMALVGEVGSGKTTVCRAVLSRLPAGVETALVLNPCLTGNQLMQAILQDLGVEARTRDRLRLVEMLNQFLLDRANRGVNVAVVIDEAQDMSPELMEQVRLLSNLETDAHKLMQMVLAGQPELDRRLAMSELRQLRQRISIRCVLDPLEPEDVRGYVGHRLRIAGADDAGLFDDAALRVVHRASHGIPRLINKVCDRAMLAGFAAGVRRIGAAECKRAVREMEGIT